MTKKILCLGLLMLIFFTISQAKPEDKVKVVWNDKKVSVKAPRMDSLSVETHGGKVCIRNKHNGKELHFVLTGKSTEGAFEYHGKNKAVFTLDGLSLNSTDSIPLNFKNSKKTVLKFKGDNNITVSADTLDGAMIRTKGNLTIKGEGSLRMSSASVGCKGIKVGKNLVMESGTVDIETSGMYVEIDTTDHFGPPPGDFMGGDSIDHPHGGFPGPHGDFPDPHGGFPDFNEMDSIGHPHGAFPGPPGDFNPGMRPEFPDSFPDFHEGDFPGPPDGDMGGPGMKQKYNGSSKAVRVTETVTINGGNLNIKTSAPGAEGLEGKKGITINGGSVTIDAYDDAINSGGKIVFAGGTVRATSRKNDAVDSNAWGEGAITISGGNIEALSLCGAPEEGFDSDFNAILVTGGTALGMGGAMGPNPSSPSEETALQPTILISIPTIAEGDKMEIQDSTGKVVLNHLFTNAMRDVHIFFTSPDLQKTETYKAIVNQQATYSTELIAKK